MKKQARSKDGVFEVWRVDDNGNEFLVATFDDQKLAEQRVAELAEGGHKQMYWIKTVAT